MDATVVEAHRPRLNRTEKDTVRGGGVSPDWTPTRKRQIDREGRWTLKRGPERGAPPGPDGRKRIVAEIAVPMFGYKARP